MSKPVWKCPVAPHKVHQDNFDPGKGNALQAAVSSVFGMALDEVPNFIEMPGGYEAAISNFCQEKGYNCLKVKLTETAVPLDYDDYFCILRGVSPRGNFGHVVVARWTNGGFEMVHDPHPEGTFLDDKADYGWCMFFLEK